MAKTDPEMRSSLLDVLQNKKIGLLAIAAAADVIVADARFNHWLAQGGKDEAGLELIDLYEEAFQACHSAIRRFDQDSDQAEFTRALESIAEAIRTMTGRQEIAARAR